MVIDGPLALMPVTATQLAALLYELEFGLEVALKVRLLLVPG
jgi:hypothetical protein